MPPVRLAALVLVTPTATLPSVNHLPPDSNRHTTLAVTLNHYHGVTEEDGQETRALFEDFKASQSLRLAE